MSISPEGGWDATWDQIKPEEIQEVRKKRSSPDPLEGKISATELRVNIARIYNLLSKFGFKDTLVFEPDDCEEEADGLIQLFNRYPPSRVALRLIGPLAAIAAAVEKVQLLVGRRNAKLGKQPEQPDGTTPVPESVGGH